MRFLLEGAVRLRSLVPHEGEAPGPADAEDLEDGEVTTAEPMSLRAREAAARIERAAAANVAEAERLAEALERRDLVERYERALVEIRESMAGQETADAADGGPLEDPPGDPRPGGALE